MEKTKKNCFMLFLLISLMFATNTYANSSLQQQLTIQGIVVDAAGDPLPGVTVTIIGTTVGTLSGIDGDYSINVPNKDAILRFSFVGYESQEVTVGNKNVINITLNEDSQVLDEIVVVGYGTKKKESLTSAIAVIKSEDIVSTKQTDVVASLQGKIPGLLITQKSSMPGAFDNQISLRGYGEPIIVVDGVVRTTTTRNSQWGYETNSGSAFLSSMNPDDIENITVLKDASASIYGMGAGNGVILITTKKGNISKPTINYSNNIIFGVPTGWPESVDIVTYLKLKNEMAANSRKAIKYSDDFIKHYIDGDEGYVDTDWFGEMFKDHSFSHNHNLSLRGGNDQTQYYLSGNYTSDGSLLRADSFRYDRYSIRANATTKITKDLSATFQTSLSNTIDNKFDNNFQGMTFYYTALADRIFAPTTTKDSNHYTYMADSEGRNPIGMSANENNYSKATSSVFNNNIDIKYDAPFLQGLQITASGAYDFTNRQTNTLTKNFPLYDYWTDEHVANNVDKNVYSESWSTQSRIYGRTQATYNKSFGKHNVSAMLGAEITKYKQKSISGRREFGTFFTHSTINSGDASTSTNSGTRSETATAGYIGRATYDYAGKYLVEVMGRYDGTYIYAPGKRWGLFPSYSLGYRISEESFIKDNLPWVNNLKLRWSDGKTGSVQGGAYAYLLGYAASGNYVFNDGGQIQGYYNNSVAQTLLSWADIRMMDFGIDWDFFKSKFGGSFDIFKRKTTGISGKSSESIPDFYGLSLPNRNLNASENVGLDVSLTHRNKIGKFNYNVTFSATYARNRTTYLESEATKVYTSHQQYWESYTVGRWSNARGGSLYQWEGGQFTSWEDINSSPVCYQPNGASQLNMLPGMYKLDDRNGNGVIDSNDVYYTWGETNPPLQLGLMLSGSWRNFDFNMNFTGAALVHKQIMLSGPHGYGFFNNVNENYLDRWHLADGYTDPFDPESKWVSGYWPALASCNSAFNSYNNATYGNNQPYTYVNGSFIRLKGLQIGYTLPKNVTSKIGMTSARIFFSGTNLLTICNKLLKPYDPESNAGNWISGYPVVKNYSFGVNVNF